MHVIIIIISRVLSSFGSGPPDFRLPLPTPHYRLRTRENASSLKCLSSIKRKIKLKMHFSSVKIGTPNAPTWLTYKRSLKGNKEETHVLHFKCFEQVILLNLKKTQCTVDRSKASDFPLQVQSSNHLDVF